MRLMRYALVTMIAAGPAAGQTPTPAPTPDVLPSVTLPAELDRVLRDYERLWKAGDLDGLAMLFSEDGFVLSNGKPGVRGRAAIKAVYQGAGGDLRLRALDYATADTVGFILGAYAYGAGPGDHGKFILALRRARGGPWMIAADMDNSNRRPGGQ
jgi:ketosteroid isomerase-like protein